MCPASLQRPRRPHITLDVDSPPSIRPETDTMEAAIVGLAVTNLNKGTGNERTGLLNG